MQFQEGCFMNRKNLINSFWLSVYGNFRITNSQISKKNFTYNGIRQTVSVERFISDYRRQNMTSKVIPGPRNGIGTVLNSSTSHAFVQNCKLVHLLAPPYSISYPQISSQLTPLCVLLISEFHLLNFSHRKITFRLITNDAKKSLLVKEFGHRFNIFLCMNTSDFNRKFFSLIPDRAFST